MNASHIPGKFLSNLTLFLHLLFSSQESLAEADTDLFCTPGEFQSNFRNLPRVRWQSQTPPGVPTPRCFAWVSAVCVRGSPGELDPENTDVETARTPRRGVQPPVAGCPRAPPALASVGTEKPPCGVWGHSETNELLSAGAWRGWTLAFPPGVGQ